MALSKIIAEGVDLTDTFAFTGTVTGAGLTSPFANTVAVTSEGGAATTNLVQGLAKAFGSFAQNAYPDTGYTQDQAGETFNFSSITDISSGLINSAIINNTSATTYSAGCHTCYFATSGSSNEMDGVYAKTTSGWKMSNTYANGSIRDANYTGILLHGSLA